MLRDEDPLVQQYHRNLVQADYNLVRGLGDPEELQTGTQVFGREVNLVLSIAVDYGKLNVDGKDDRKQLYLVSRQGVFLVFSLTHQRGDNGVVVTGKPAILKASEELRNDKEPCTNDHDQRC